MKGFGSQSKSESINNDNSSKFSKEEIINQAFNFHSQGNIAQAAKYYQSLINEGIKDYRVFLNYGIILKNIGKLQEAELSTRKAIEVQPEFAEGHLNLGNIFKDLGKLHNADSSYRKAIKIKPDYAKAHSNLGNILRDLGKLEEAKICSEKIMSLRSWSILGSYSFNREMKLD